MPCNSKWKTPKTNLLYLSLPSGTGSPTWMDKKGEKVAS